MKLCIIISCNTPETLWNAFRLGTYARQQGDLVSIFLLGEGVECEDIQDETFPVVKQMQEFVNDGGEILACGTCLKLRQSDASELCPISTMADLYRLVSESDRLLTF